MVMADKVISRHLRRRPCQGDHYWLLPQRPQPGERDVEGVCCKCHARRMFPCFDWNDVLRPEFKKHMKAGHGVVPLILNESEGPRMKWPAWVKHKGSR